MGKWKLQLAIFVGMSNYLDTTHWKPFKSWSTMHVWDHLWFYCCHPADCDIFIFRFLWQERLFFFLCRLRSQPIMSYSRYNLRWKLLFCSPINTKRGAFRVWLCLCVCVCKRESVCVFIFTYDLWVPVVYTFVLVEWPLERKFDTLPVPGRFPSCAVSSRPDMGLWRGGQSSQ